MKNILLIISCIALLVYILLFTVTTLRNTKTTLMAKSGALITIGFTLVYLYLLLINDTHIVYLISSFLALHLTSILNGYAIHGKLNSKHHLIKLGISLLFVVVFMYL